MSFGESLRRAASGEYIEPPTAKYNVRVVQGDARETKSGPVAEVILEILEGEHRGGRMKHLMFFNHPVGVEINTEALVSYGVELDKINEVNDLDTELQRILGTEAEVGVSYRNDYIQFKVHRSRPPQPKSDIPNDLPAEPVEPGQQQQQQQPSFAQAAGQAPGAKFGDVPFD
jgi:hypothetical protein